MRGIVIIERTLEKAVIVTDKAVSPLMRYVIIFEEGPPGQLATKINPIASSEGKFNNLAITSATAGRSSI